MNVAVIGRGIRVPMGDHTDTRDGDMDFAGEQVKSIMSGGEGAVVIVGRALVVVVVVDIGIETVVVGGSFEEEEEFECAEKGKVEGGVDGSVISVSFWGSWHPANFSAQKSS